MGQKCNAVLRYMYVYTHFLWMIMKAEGLTRRMGPLSSIIYPHPPPPYTLVLIVCISWLQSVESGGWDKLYPHSVPILFVRF
jgi:hypothetical protein